MNRSVSAAPTNLLSDSRARVKETLFRSSSLTSPMVSNRSLKTTVVVAAAFAAIKHSHVELTFCDGNRSLQACWHSWHTASNGQFPRRHGARLCLRDGTARHLERRRRRLPGGRVSRDPRMHQSGTHARRSAAQHSRGDRTLRRGAGGGGLVHFAALGLEKPSPALAS